MLGEEAAIVRSDNAVVRYNLAPVCWTAGEDNVA